MSKTPEQTALDAAEARMILSHPMVVSALEKIKDRVVEAIEENPMTDELMRDKLMLTLQVRRQFIEDLTKHIEDAQMAESSQE